jgi:hypothetical protein
MGVPVNNPSSEGNEFKPGFRLYSLSYVSNCLYMMIMMGSYLYVFKIQRTVGRFQLEGTNNEEGDFVLVPGNTIENARLISATIITVFSI